MVNLCSRSPCKNKGTCIQEKAESWCLCPSGWTGAYCDVPNVSCEVAASRRGELCPLGRGPLPEAFTDQQRFRGRCGYRGVTRKGLRRKPRGQRERLRDSAEKRVCMPRRLYPGHLSRGTQVSAVVNRTTVNTGVGVFSSVAHRFTPWNVTQPVAATRMLHRVSCQVKSVGWGKTNTVWLPLYVERLKTKHTDTDS